MVFPCLVDKRFCNTPIEIIVESTELNEDGELVEGVVIDTKCNLQLGARASFTKDKEAIKLSGIALLVGDLCPQYPVIASGVAIIYGQQYSINKVTKNLNPDGTVNYTTLELI